MTGGVPHPHPHDYSAEEWLSAYLDGELQGEELAQAEQRLAADPQARACLEELRAVSQSLSSSLKQLSSGSLGAGFAQQVLRQAEHEVLGVRGSAENHASEANQTPASRDTLALDRADRHRRRWLYVSVAIAASLLVMIFVPQQPGNREVADRREADKRTAKQIPAEKPADGSVAPMADGSVAPMADGSVAPMADGAPRQRDAQPAMSARSAPEANTVSEASRVPEANRVPEASSIPEARSAPLAGSAPAGVQTFSSPASANVSRDSNLAGTIEHSAVGPAPPVQTVVESRVLQSRAVAESVGKNLGLAEPAVGALTQSLLAVDEPQLAGRVREEMLTFVVEIDEADAQDIDLFQSTLDQEGIALDEPLQSHNRAMSTLANPARPTRGTQPDQAIQLEDAAAKTNSTRTDGAGRTANNGQPVTSAIESTDPLPSAAAVPSDTAATGTPGATGAELVYVVATEAQLQGTLDRLKANKAVARLELIRAPEVPWQQAYAEFGTKQTPPTAATTNQASASPTDASSATDSVAGAPSGIAESDNAATSSLASAPATLSRARRLQWSAEPATAEAQAKMAVEAGLFSATMSMSENVASEAQAAGTAQTTGTLQTTGTADYQRAVFVIRIRAATAPVAPSATNDNQPADDK